ncbi:MAG: serine hydrolase [Flavobacteriaceae bacterium]|nr:serine hydrolase [Flavobacteriaceae bacterium]
MKHYRYLFLCCLFALAAQAQFNQKEAIDSLFMEWDNTDTPGAALGIFKDGETLYAKGYGMANMEYDIPNNAQSVFRIASTSKQFTAACIVLLAEEGKLSLDDSLRSIFPDFPAYAEQITVRHLLNHTSGIRDYLSVAYLKGLSGDDFYTDSDIMAWLVRQTDLNFNPGDEFLYSNSGYWLLGQIVNIKSGMNMADYAQKKLFVPLGMDHTHFHNDHNRIVRNRATGYTPTEDGGYEISRTTLDMIGDGGIFTSIADIKKWDDAYYDREVLSDAFWAEMTQQGVLNDGETIEYASGLFVETYKGLKTINHGGAFVGFRAELMRFPEERLTIALFANRADANPSRKAGLVADILLKDQLQVDDTQEVSLSPQTLPPPEVIFDLEQIIGTYEIEVGVTVDLSVANDTLQVIQNWNKATYPLLRTQGNSFQIPGRDTMSFTFSALEDGQTQTMTVDQEGRQTIANRKAALDLSGVDVNDFVGSYYSPELDATYSFTLENGLLEARIGGMGTPSECTPNAIDQYTFRYGLLRFQRKDGQISGFELDSGRVKNLKFNKQGS